MGFQNWQNVQEKLQELEEWLSFERRKTGGPTPMFAIFVVGCTYYVTSRCRRQVDPNSATINCALSPRRLQTACSQATVIQRIRVHPQLVKGLSGSSGPAKKICQQSSRELPPVFWVLRSLPSWHRWVLGWLFSVAACDSQGNSNHALWRVGMMMTQPDTWQEHCILFVGGHCVTVCMYLLLIRQRGNWQTLIYSWIILAYRHIHS